MSRTLSKSEYGLQDILAEISTHGMAKANRYEVLITTPPSVLQYSSSKAQGNEAPGSPSAISSRIGARLSVFCDSAQLPPTRILTSRQQIFGPPSFHPIGADYGGDNLSLTFALDRWYSVKEFFDVWVDSIVGRDTGTVSYQSEYLCQGLSISQLDEEDQVHYRAVFEDVFPIAVNPIQLGYDMNNQVSKMSVTFCYRRWRNVILPAPQTPLVRRSENQVDLRRTSPAVADRARVGRVAGT